MFAKEYNIIEQECKDCDKKFDNLSDLNKHINIFHKESPCDN